MRFHSLALPAGWNYAAAYELQAMVNIGVKVPLPGNVYVNAFMACKNFQHEAPHSCLMNSIAAPSSDARPSGAPGSANAAGGAAAGRGEAANGAAAGAHMRAAC